MQCEENGDVHRGVLQHVWDNEESDHTSSDVYLIKLGHTAIPLGHSNIFEGDVQVVLSYKEAGATRQ